MGEGLAVGNTDAAARGAGAGDHVGGIPDGLLDRHAERPHRRDRLVHRLRRDAEDSDVLFARGAQAVAAEALGDVGEAVELVRRQQPQWGVRDHAEAAVVLGDHAARRGRFRGVAGLAPCQGLPGPLGQRLGAGELFVEKFAEGLLAEALDDELDARGVAVTPVRIALVEAHQRLEHRRQLALDDEVADQGSGARDAAEAAAGIDLEALPAVLDRRHQPEIVDRGGAAVSAAARHRRLELARHVLDQRMADPASRQPLGDLARIDVLARADAGKRAGAHVAERVAAGLAGGYPRLAQRLEQRRGLVEFDVVDLEILARGDMRVALGEAAGDVGHLARPGDRQDAAGNLDAHHLHAGLALAVDAEPEPEGGEAVVGPVSRPVLGDRVAEGVDIRSAGQRLGRGGARRGDTGCCGTDGAGGIVRHGDLPRVLEPTNRGTVGPNGLGPRRSLPVAL